MATAQQKVLRIGVIQGGKIIEERLLKRRETVTIGQGPKNTFVIPASDLPQSFTLFELKGNQYTLGFDEKMDGRVSMTETAPVDFAALRQSGQATAKGPGVFQVNLPDTARGKVQLGEVTVLFQFVPAQAEQKVQLPPEVRGGLKAMIVGLDVLFVGLLAGSLTLNFLTVFLISQREVDETVTLADIPDRFTKMIMPEKPVELPKEEEKPAESETKTAAKEPAKEAAPKDTGPKEPVSREQIEKQVSKSGLLAVLGSEGEGGALDDVLSSGAGAADVATALEGAGRVGIASTENLAAGTRGDGTGRAQDIGALGTTGGGGVSLGEKKDVVVAKIESYAPEVESTTVDAGAVTRFIKARINSINSCYERELKRNNSLKGKVVVRFVITTSGRVGEVDIEENSTNANVGSCIRAVVKGWQFPFKPEEDAAVANTFVFTPSSG